MQFKTVICLNKNDGLGLANGAPHAVPKTLAGQPEDFYRLTS